MSYRRKHIKPKLSKLKPKKKLWQRQMFWFLLFFVLVAIAAIYFIFFFPAIQIQKVYISGNKTVATEAIEAVALKQIHKNMLPAAIITISSGSMLLENPKELEEVILDAFPIIKTVRVVKQWPQQLSIDIEERVPYAVFCPVPETATCFDIDETGVIFQESYQSNQKTTFYQSVSGGSLPGDQVVKAERMRAIVKLKNSLEQRFEIPVAQVDIANPIIFTTTEGWKLYANPDEAIDVQLAKLEALLSNQITPQARKSLQYIYLQYRDRAYYK